jgi:hypothetical protein
MAWVTLVEKMKINCFCGNLPKDDEPRQHRLSTEDDHAFNYIRNRGAQYNIGVLPAVVDFTIDNLYPETNEVHKWNTLIIGNDKTFIHVSIFDLQIPEALSLMNQKVGTALSPELQMFFDPIFDRTLHGNKLQFLISWRGHIYLVNTYPLTNQKDEVIGAVIFIRNCNLLPFQKMSVEMHSPLLGASAL